MFLVNTMFERIAILQKIKLTATFSDHRNTAFLVLRIFPEIFKLLNSATYQVDIIRNKRKTTSFFYLLVSPIP